MSEERGKIPVTGKAGAKGQWYLHQERGNIVLASGDQTKSYIYAPEDFHIKIFILKLAGGTAHLMAELEPKKKGSFEIAKGYEEELAYWLGPISKKAMQAAINETTRFSLPLGIFFVVIAFLGKNETWDYQSLLLGGTLLGFYALGKFSVTPMVLLVDWCWFVLAIIFISWRIFQGNTVLYIDIPLLVFFLLILGFKWGNYRRFSSYKERREESPGESDLDPEFPGEQ